MTLPEMIDYIQMDLTASCALPKILPDAEVQRLLLDQAAIWFYENDIYSLIRSYFYIPKDNMMVEPATSYRYIILPKEIQSVVWTYQLKDRALFELGINAPNLSLNLGVTNQPYLSSYMTTIGELGVYKVIIDGFSDVLNQLSKHTLKFDYNFAARRLHILTGLQGDFIIEAFVRIPEEDLFESEKFRRYALGLARRQLGRMLGIYDFTLPGNVKINGDKMIEWGQKDIDAVTEEIKAVTNSSFIMMIKR